MLPLTFPISVDGKPIFPDSQAETLDSSLTPLFLSHPTYNLSRKPVCFTIKIYPESDHLPCPCHQHPSRGLWHPNLSLLSSFSIKVFSQHGGQRNPYEMFILSCRFCAQTPPVAKVITTSYKTPHHRCPSSISALISYCPTNPLHLQPHWSLWCSHTGQAHSGLRATDWLLTCWNSPSPDICIADALHCLKSLLESHPP